MKNHFTDNDWLADHRDKIKRRAGHRYTPALNVDLPISDLFNGISRTKEFYTDIRTHAGKLNRTYRQLSIEYEHREVRNAVKRFQIEINKLLQTLEPIKQYDTDDINWKKIKSCSFNCVKRCWELVEKLHEEKSRRTQENIGPIRSRNSTLANKSYIPQTNPLEKLDDQLRNVHAIREEIDYFEEFSSDLSAQLSNNPFLLTKGQAGSGKTHLLCDLVDNRNNSSAPAVLCFGEHFSPGKDIWEQILKQLGLENRYRKDTFLRDLDRAGKKAKSRSLLIIDALNETRPNKFWKRYLKEVTREIGKYPNVGLVVSVRSGFENEVLTKNQEKFFVVSEHYGFQFREWEAVSKFFSEFSLPLPDIPLLLPEFQNPLFLLLFCKAFEQRNRVNIKNNKQKQIFRGHEGATYIFENFIDAASRRVEKEFGIDHGTGRNIWDTVVEKVAEYMVVKNTDRIPEERLFQLLSTAHPTVDNEKLIQALDRNLILIRVIRYNYKKNQTDGFDFRFPFQKFSDHLICRFIFKKYRLGNRTARQFFAKNTDLGKFLAKYTNRGIVEALSIQCPEYLNGTEFFELARYINNSVLIETLIESLVWRKPDAFASDNKKLLSFIKKHINMRDDWFVALFDAVLSVAAVPNHPFNAEFLHRHLAKYTMSRRDAWWIPYLNQQFGERSSIDRLIDWAWSTQDKSHVVDESIKLYAIALAWFLCSSNRSLRDRTTKALISILTNRIPIIIELLVLFNTVDDPYIRERLYAVAYGCALRNKGNNKHLKRLAEWFLSNVFEKDKVPDHILMRDYAAGVVEVALKEKAVNQKERKKITPPFGSKWPKRIHSTKFLEKKYYLQQDDPGQTGGRRRYLSIWKSVMYNTTNFPGDFGKYVINPALGNFNNRKLSDPRIDRKALYEEFKNTLDKNQKILLDTAGYMSKANMMAYFDRNKSKVADSSTTGVEKDTVQKYAESLRKLREVSLRELKRQLSNEQIDLFTNEIEPYLDKHGHVYDPADYFNTSLAQRWIFKRVVELGWNEKLHGRFDNEVQRFQYSRSAPKSERIGKKYQWIAFHELLGLVADNFQYRSDRWTSDADGQDFEGVWQLSVRDIDPSCILNKPPNKIPSDIPVFSEYIPDYNKWHKGKKIGTWIKDLDDLPDPKSFIELTDTDGEQWIVLEGFFEWQEETPPEYERYDIPMRTLFYMLKSYLVEQEKVDSFYRWSKKQNFFGRWMPESHDFYNVFLGEYPSYPAFLHQYIPYYHHDDWTDNTGSDSLPAKILVTDDVYLSSGSSRDQSTDEAISIKMPAKWIIDNMNLNQPFMDGRLYDKNRILVAFYAHIFDENTPQFLLMRKSSLVNFLQQKKLSIVWTLLGEKHTIGGPEMGQPYGLLEINGSYALGKNRKIKGSIKTELKYS